MKHILLYLFFLISLLGAKDVKGAVLSGEGIGTECAIQERNSISDFLLELTELPEDGEANVKVESLTHQYRVSGRTHRSFSVQQMCWGKNPGYRAARKHLEALLHTTNNVYSSLPVQSWAVSSEHYVFGMRRILI